MWARQTSSVRSRQFPMFVKIAFVAMGMIIGLAAIAAKIFDGGLLVSWVSDGTASKAVAQGEQFRLIISDTTLVWLGCVYAGVLLFFGILKMPSS
ncbi:MAG: hypothetical protein ACR2QH_15380 [Geminicoccaceae bacterium]